MKGITREEAYKFWKDDPLRKRPRVKLDQPLKRPRIRLPTEEELSEVIIRMEQVVTPKRRAVGRPTTYDPKYVGIAAKAMRIGYTKSELADLLDTTIASLHNWSMTHPAFFNALKLNKDAADDRVVHSLYEKATGWWYIDDDGVKRQTAPSDGAIFYWLGNRQGDQWKSVHRTEITGVADGPPIKTISATMSAMEAADLYSQTLNSTYVPPLIEGEVNKED